MVAKLSVSPISHPVRSRSNRRRSSARLSAHMATPRYVAGYARWLTACRLLLPTLMLLWMISTVKPSSFSRAGVSSTLTIRSLRRSGTRLTTPPVYASSPYATSDEVRKWELQHLVPHDQDCVLDREFPAADPDDPQLRNQAPDHSPSHGPPATSFPGCAAPRQRRTSPVPAGGHEPGHGPRACPRSASAALAVPSALVRGQGRPGTAVRSPVGKCHRQARHASHANEV